MQVKSGKSTARLAGRGQFAFEDGRKYEGSFKWDALDGTFLCSIRTGQERRNSPVCVVGYGSMTWPDGAQYSGMFRHSSIEGKGQMSKADGSGFVGEFLNGTQVSAGMALLSSHRRRCR